MFDSRSARCTAPKFFHSQLSKALTLALVLLQESSARCLRSLRSISSSRIASRTRARTCVRHTWCRTVIVSRPHSTRHQRKATSAHGVPLAHIKHQIPMRSPQPTTHAQQQHTPLNLRHAHGVLLAYAIPTLMRPPLLTTHAQHLAPPAA